MSNTVPVPAPTAATTFSYDALSDEDAAAVRAATERLRAALARTARLIVFIGTALHKVRGRLSKYHGAWSAYLRSEVPWSREQVRRLIRAAEVFRTVAEIDSFTPTALYLLAWPSAPPAAAREAVELARAGKPVDAKTAKRLVAACRPTPPAAEGADEADPGALPEYVPAEDADPTPDSAEIGELVAAALRRFHTLHVCDHGEDGEGDGVTVTAYPRGEGDGIRYAHRATVTGALRHLLGREEEGKRCRTCQEVRPFGLFCKNADEADGLNPVCRRCEKGRREEAKRKEDAARGGGPARNRPPRPAV